MIVCGVDPSLTSAGVAILQNGQPVHTASPGYTQHGGGYHGKSWRQRNRRGRHQARLIRDAALTAGPPDLVVIEEHPYAANPFGSEFDRIFLWGKTFEAFDVYDYPTGIPVAVINNSTLKVWVTGKGAIRDPSLTRAQRQKRNKQLMTDTVQAWWPDWPIANDDEADALGLAAIGAYHLGDPLPFPLKDRHRTALENITWP